MKSKVKKVCIFSFSLIVASYADAVVFMPKCEETSVS